jgi:hypothetical protein
VVGGVFTRINGVARHNIARLNSDGTVDTTFNPPTLARPGFQYAWLYAVALNQDGKVLMGGDFTRVNGLSRNYLVRLNTNGSLDTSFNAFSTMTPMCRMGMSQELSCRWRILVRAVSKVHGVETRLVRWNRMAHWTPPPSSPTRSSRQDL